MSQLQQNLRDGSPTAAVAASAVREDAPLDDLLTQIIQRRPNIKALALVSPGGKLWASALPEGVEAESVGALAAPVALLGRRVAMEQLGADMRQVYVEGEGGYAVLRAIGDAAVLLAIADADANLALVLHDVEMLENRVAQVLGVAAARPSAWAEAGPAIERLRRLVREGETSEMQEKRVENLRAKLESLDLGLFPERVAALRARLRYPHHLEEIEAALLTLELDVTRAVDQRVKPSAPAPARAAPMAVKRAPSAGAKPQLVESVPTPREQVSGQNSFVRRALKWLASMIESED